MNHLLHFTLLASLIFSSFTLEKTIPMQATDFRLDDLGNIYAISANHLEKYNAAGVKMFRTSDLNFGTIDYLDLTNPLKPFLYYRDQAKILMLDNTLSVQGEAIDLFELSNLQVELVAGSRGDAFWLWDVLNAELIRVNSQLQKLNSSGNVAVLLGKSIYPEQILERGDYVYVLDPKQGIFIFDIYGNYKTTLTAKVDGNIQVMNGQVIYSSAGQLHVVESDLLTEHVFDLTKEMLGPFSFFNGKYYLLRSDRLEVYNLNDN